MNVRLISKTMAWGGFLLGVCAIILSVTAKQLHVPAWLFFALLSSILGTLLSVSVIFIRTRYGLITRWNHISVISVALCSLPVLYVIFLLLFEPRQ